MKFADYHVHSNHSCDGKATLFEMCQKAIELGIVEIGFSEHMDFEPKDWCFGFFDYEKYTSEIESAQEFFKDKLVIRKGIEIDYQQAFEDDIREWLKSKEFDFIIGSVHYVNHEIIDRTLSEHKDLEKIYQAYFKEVALSVRSCLFDVVGHLDVMRKYVNVGRGELSSFDYEESIGMVQDIIVEKKMYLEMNSCVHACMTNIDMLPSKEAVEEFIGKGGRLISIGSDAHSTEEIGGRIREILSFLESCDGDKFTFLFE